MDWWVITRDAYDAIQSKSPTELATALKETNNPNRIWVELDDEVVKWLAFKSIDDETLSDVIIRMLSVKH